jgi:transcriptional regulator of nitric oxide reductase
VYRGDRLLGYVFLTATGADPRVLRQADQRWSASTSPAHHRPRDRAAREPILAAGITEARRTRSPTSIAASRYSTGDDGAARGHARRRHLGATITVMVQNATVMQRRARGANRAA